MSIKNTYTPIRLGNSSIDFTEALNSNFNISKNDIKWLFENTGGRVGPATEESLGGIKASPKTDNETVEVKIGANNKLYAPAMGDSEEIWEAIRNIQKTLDELKLTIATI